MSGAPVAVSETGAATCTRPGDATVRVSLGAVTTTVLLRCRPVHSVRVAAPVQLVLGEDSIHDLDIEARGMDGTPVVLLAATVWIGDSTIATLEGARVRPRSPGATLLQVTIGDKYGRAGVHIYERLASLDDLRREQDLVAVPLRLGNGEMRRWPLPAGEWMLTMLPEEDEGRGLQLRIERANCLPSGISKRRYVCLAKQNASVIVYSPASRAPASELRGELLVRRWASP